jgi:GTP 3',8-cyclase
MIKPGYGDNRNNLADLLPLKTPLSVIVTPTTRCQLKCNYCPQSFSEKILAQAKFVREDMSSKTYEKIINQLREFPDKLKAMHFQGMGEPLLHERIAWMVHTACVVAEKTTLITNGIGLTYDMSDQLICSGLDTIKISLQGMGNAKMLDNIRYFHRNKDQCEVYVKTVDSCLKPGEEKKFYKRYESIADRVFVEKVCPMQEGVPIVDTSTNMYGQNRMRYEVCSLGFYMMYITPHGNVFPCCNYYDPAGWGDINRMTLKEIWEGPSRKVFLLMMLKGYRNKYPYCKRCFSPESCLRQEEYLDNRATELLERLK